MNSAFNGWVNNFAILRKARGNRNFPFPPQLNPRGTQSLPIIPPDSMSADKISRSTCVVMVIVLLLALHQVRSAVENRKPVGVYVYAAQPLAQISKSDRTTVVGNSNMQFGAVCEADYP